MGSNAAAVDTRGGWQPSLSLELAIAEVLDTPEEAPVEKPVEKSAPVKKPARTAPAETKAPKAEVKSKPEQEALVSLSSVVDAWRDVRSLVKPDHPSIEALLNSCKPLDVRGNELYLGFQSDKVRELFEIPERVSVAQEAIAEVLNVELIIKCVVTNAQGQLPPDISPDSMVAAAIQNGGEIVDTQD